MSAPQPFTMPMYPPSVMLMPAQPAAGLPQASYGTPYMDEQVRQRKPQLRRRPMGNYVDRQRNSGGFRHSHGHNKEETATRKILRNQDLQLK